jgi:hypothetical protein
MLNEGVGSANKVRGITTEQTPIKKADLIKQQMKAAK